jgi:nucleotide-binding universal stress UspA family protein
MRTLIEHGPPEAMLSAYVMEQGADLTVVGAYERGRIFHALVGGNGPRIVESIPSDVMVVRAHRDDTDAA